MSLLIREKFTPPEVSNSQSKRAVVTQKMIQKQEKACYGEKEKKLSYKFVKKVMNIAKRPSFQEIFVTKTGKW